MGKWIRRFAFDFRGEPGGTVGDERAKMAALGAVMSAIAKVPPPPRPDQRVPGLPPHWSNKTDEARTSIDGITLIAWWEWRA